eukprot:TRINITY_DN9468_c0_g1_i1.p1 TRINITY_DN9468_c0_g1~~TRINITY_DN9468_c0_g1_i1.p1  ORF type:complete len:62 (+),score=4.34 TRINITY_DN9468_c0_g1_i1:77-262(+)
MAAKVHVSDARNVVSFVRQDRPKNEKIKQNSNKLFIKLARRSPVGMKRHVKHFPPVLYSRS